MVGPAGGAASPDDAVHPGPARVLLPAAIRAAIVEHARAEYPNEACGIVSGSADPAAGGTALDWFPARNAAASRWRYTIDPQDALRIFLEIDDADRSVWAIVHSHVQSPAVPSPTDVGLAAWPEALYVLVSLAEDQADPATGEPSVRGWRIVDGRVHEVELVAEP